MPIQTIKFLITGEFINREINVKDPKYLNSARTEAGQLVASSFIQLIRYSFGQAIIRSFLHSFLPSFIHSYLHSVVSPPFAPIQTIKFLITGEFINREINVKDPKYLNSARTEAGN